MLTGKKTEKYALLASGGVAVAGGFVQLGYPDPNSNWPSWWPYIQILLGGVTIFYASKL